MTMLDEGMSVIDGVPNRYRRWSKPSSVVSEPIFEVAGTVSEAAECPSRVAETTARGG